MMHRLARLPGSSYSIASGFAMGAAISFTPFVGFHIVISATLSWIIRGNIVASAVGTIVGNPWTFPFIWIWLYESGHWMLGTSREEMSDIPDFYASFSMVGEALLRFDLASLYDIMVPVVWPMFISGIPTAMVVWIVFYIPLAKLIAKYQRRRIRRLLKLGDRRSTNKPDRRANKRN